MNYKCLKLYQNPCWRSACTFTQMEPPPLRKPYRKHYLQLWGHIALVTSLHSWVWEKKKTWGERWDKDEFSKKTKKQLFYWGKKYGIQDISRGTRADRQQFWIGCHMVNVLFLLQSDDPVSASRDGTDRVLIQGRAGEAWLRANGRDSQDVLTMHE